MKQFDNTRSDFSPYGFTCEMWVPARMPRPDRHNGLHPNYAMNLFRQTFGTTMTHFITEHRISHAQRLLVTTDEAILTVP